MFKSKICKSLLLSPFLLAISYLQTSEFAVSQVVSPIDNSVAKTETPQTVTPYTQENREKLLAQINSINQLRDVSPRDWSFEALRNLVEGYGCIVGYPDRTYRGERALSRNEFAAGLNACLQQLERRLSAVNTTNNAGSPPERFETGLSIQEAFYRGFNNASGDFFGRTGLGGQLNGIFGWRSFPQGSFPENDIARDGETVSTILKDVLQQQADSFPIVRTRDLENPFNTSLQDNPSYFSNGQPIGGRGLIIETNPTPFFP